MHFSLSLIKHYKHNNDTKCIYEYLILALCFFKVPGLASALLQTLPVEEDTVLSIRKELIGDDDVSAQEYSS